MQRNFTDNLILYINTSDFDKVEFALIFGNGEVKHLSQTLAYNENYKTNLLLEKFLKANKIALHDLTKIFVCSGPGSFTGIRVGVSLAQALGFALNMPVYALSQELVPENFAKLATFKASKKTVLHYGAEPNITKPKK